MIIGNLLIHFYSEHTFSLFKNVKNIIEDFDNTKLFVIIAKQDTFYWLSRFLNEENKFLDFLTLK